MDLYISAARLGISAQGVPSKEYLDNLPKGVESISRLSWANLEAGQNQLTERTYMVGLLGIIAAKAKCNDFATNLDQFLVFFQSFLPTLEPAQIRACPSLIVDICEKVKTGLIVRGRPSQGILLLTQAAKMYQIHERQLTSIHTNVLELCLSASNPKAGLTLITDDIDDFSPEIRGSDCKNLILYNYYAGMVCTALKMYRNAIHHFEAAILCPASTLSHIMLEAYKKLILVCLILDGEMPATHKGAAQVVGRLLKPEATPYVDLATSFAKFNPTELNAMVNRHREVFVRDGNFGLVKQVQSAQTKLSILRLTKTFLTLSLADVAARVQLQGAVQAEAYLVSMIQDGEIFAKINQKDGMVVFLENKEKYDSSAMMQKIEQQIMKCMDLNKRLEQMNDKLLTNPEYISRIVCSNEDDGITSSKSMFSSV